MVQNMEYTESEGMNTCSWEMSTLCLHKDVSYDTKFWREKILVNLANLRDLPKCSCRTFSFLKAEVFGV